MNSNHNDTTSSKKSLQLPEPDLTNITALSHNLPSTPIIPDALKKSVNAVLSFFGKGPTQSHEKLDTKQNQAD